MSTYFRIDMPNHSSGGFLVLGFPTFEAAMIFKQAAKALNQAIPPNGKFSESLVVRNRNVDPNRYHDKPNVTNKLFIMSGPPKPEGAHTIEMGE